MQMGTPVEIYERPQNKFVADFIGETNFMEGKIERVEGERAWVLVDTLQAEVQGTLVQNLSVGAKAVISIRPEKIRLAEKSAFCENCFSVVIQNSAYNGSDTRLEVLARGQRLKVWEQNHISTLDPRAYHQKEQQAWVMLLPENALVLPAE